MPLISQIRGRTVANKRGSVLGTVADVLFHPSEPEVIGLAVQPPATLYVIERAQRFIPLTEVTLDEDGTGFVYSGSRLPSFENGTKAIGHDWETTVIWRGMPVRSADGEAVGAVKDARVRIADGSVRTLEVSTGAVGDLALGTLTIQREQVVGFDGESVVLTVGYRDAEKSGGLARSTAGGVAAASVRGQQVAKQAYDAGMKAAIKVGRSFKHGTGRRMLDKLRELTDDSDEE